MTPDARPLRVMEICTIEDLNGLEPHWNHLVQECPFPSVFMTFEWITAWLSSQASRSHELFVLVVMEDDQILGIAPFKKIRSTHLGLKLNAIEFITMMEYADSPVNCSGTLDLIIPGRTEEVISTILSYLIHERPDWHYIRLHPIPEESKTRAAMAIEAQRRGLLFRTDIVFESLYIDARDGWDSYFNTRSSGYRKRLRYRDRKLRQFGSLEFREYHSLDQLTNGYDDIVDIEKGSWKWRKGVSINSVAFGDFYRRFADVAGGKGWLRLWMVEINGRKIAYNYDVEFGHTIETLKCSFREEYRDCSPGAVLEWKEFAQLVGRGIKRINLLWGTEEHKRHWSTHTQPHYEIFVFNRGFVPRILSVFFFNLSLYRTERIILELWARLMRKAGVTLRNSPLTRIDQIDQRGD